MPLFDGEEPVTLGEGFTPLFHARALGATLGLDRLYIKDESLNPTNSFKARGQSAAITRAQVPRRDARLRCRRPATPATPPPPTPPRAGLRLRGLPPAGTSSVRSSTSASCTAPNVTLVDGLITDAGRIAAENGGPLGWYDVSTLKEPYRIEGKKTMAYELAEQMDWRLARLDRLSDRRRHRHGRHVEGVRGDRAHRLGEAGDSGRAWCRCRPRAARRSSARSSRATEKAAAVGGRHHDRRRSARAARDRRFPDPARRARERRHGARGPRSRDGRRDARDRQARRASAPRRKAAPRWPRSSGWSPTARSSRTTRSCCSTPAARSSTST